MAELDLARPNTPDLTLPVCWLCGVTKQHLKHDWLLDPFGWHFPSLDIYNFPKACIYQAPLSTRRYDWMHGVSNMLSNTIKNLLKSIPPRSHLKTQIKDHLFDCLDRRIHSKFKNNSTFIPREMKKFFELDMHLTLPPLLDQHTLQPFPTPSRTQMYTPCLGLALGLDAIRYYNDYAYKPRPTVEETQQLHEARTRVLSLYAGNKWPLTPTLHFMTNEAIILAEQDGTAYNTLQEGVEHENYFDKVLSRNTLRSSEHVYTGINTWQQVLDNQQLIRHIQKCHLSPSTNTILLHTVDYLFENVEKLIPLVDSPPAISMLMCLCRD
jgi:hypothetical protein